MQEYISPPLMEWESLLARPTASYEALEPVVENVFEAVKTRGDSAVREFTAQFDQVTLSDFKVTREALEKAGE